MTTGLWALVGAVVAFVLGIRKSKVPQQWVVLCLSLVLLLQQ